MLTKLIILTSLLISSGLLSNAQTDSIKAKRRVIIGYYSDGTAIYGNFSNLNTAITQQGYPPVQDIYTGVSFGLSFRNINRKAYSSFSFSYFRNDPIPLYDASRVKDTRVSMWTLHFGNYFDLSLHPKWLVYPYFGFGAGMANLTLYDNVNTQTSFASSIFNLNSPVHKTWTDAFIYMDIGAGFERKFRIWIYNFYAGLSGGYRLSTNARFREPYQNYSDSPSVRLSGLEWSFRLRFEIARLLRLKKSTSTSDPRIK